MGSEQHMKITMWGTRGSLPSPGAAFVKYGGNTPCVEVRANDGSLLILDAGSGIRLLGNKLASDTSRIDILLSHLHMDHIQGLGFFAPLFMSDREVHIWGPPSALQDLAERLEQYLSPPLFPIRLREVACRLTIHSISHEQFTIGPFLIKADLICHPDPTLGFKIIESGTSIAYLPDHEPALCSYDFPNSTEWLSGYEVAKGADILIHDAQYTDKEYSSRVGWGHSSIDQAISFAKACNVKQLLLFHHDPMHDDQFLDTIAAEVKARNLPFEVNVSQEGISY